jgi:hypothetical protein
MPREPRAEAPSRPVGVRLSPGEVKWLSLAARLNRQSLSEFIREAALSKAVALEGAAVAARRSSAGTGTADTAAAHGRVGTATHDRSGCTARRGA